MSRVDILCNLKQVGPNTGVGSKASKQAGLLFVEF